MNNNNISNPVAAHPQQDVAMAKTSETESRTTHGIADTAQFSMDVNRGLNLVQATPDIPAPITHGVSEQRDIQALAQRTFVLAQIDWTNTTDNLIIPLVPTKSATGHQAASIAEYLHSFSVFRTNITILAYVNGTAFHQGAIAVSYIPRYADLMGLTSTNNTYEEALTYPHMMLEASSSATSQMEIAYNNVRQYLDYGMLDRGYLGALQFTVISPLVASLSAATTLSITLNVQFPQNDSVGYITPEFNSVLADPPSNADLLESKLSSQLESMGFSSIDDLKRAARLTGSLKRPMSLEQRAEFLRNVGLEVSAFACCAVCLKDPCVCDAKKNPTSNDSAIAQQQSGNPFSGALDTISSMVSSVSGIAEAVAPIATLVGGFLDHPVDSEKSVKVRPRTANSFVHAVGTNDSTALSMGACPTLPVDQNFFKTHDVLDLARTESPFLNIAVNLADMERGYEVARWYVHPTLSVNQEYSDSTLTRYNSKLSYASFPFAWWTGAIRHRLQIFTTGFTTGRLAWIWRPQAPDLSPLTGGFLDNMSKMHTRVWEVNGPCSDTYEVPYLSLNSWSVIDHPNAYFPGAVYPPPTTRDLGDYQVNNGTLHLVVVNKFVTGVNAPTTLTILGTHWAGDDFDLAYPIGSSYVGTRIGLPIGAGNLTKATDINTSFMDRPIFGLGPTESIEVKPFSGNATAFAVEEDPSVQHDTMGGESASAVQAIPPNPTSNLAVRTIGERHSVLKNLLARDQFLATCVLPKTIEPNVRSIRRVYIPVTPCEIFGSLDLGIGSGITKSQTHLSWFSKAFAYWYGSLRYKFIIRNAELGSKDFQLRVNFVPRDGATYLFSPVFSRATKCPTINQQKGFTTSTVDGDSISDTEMSIGFNNGIHLEQSHIQSVTDVTVPWTSPRSYAICPEQEIYVTAGGITLPFCLKESVTGFLEVTVLYNNPDSISYLDILIAAGDDFTFGYPTRVPTTYHQSMA